MADSTQPNRVGLKGGPHRLNHGGGIPPKTAFIYSIKMTPQKILRSFSENLTPKRSSERIALKVNNMQLPQPSEFLAGVTQGIRDDAAIKKQQREAMQASEAEARELVAQTGVSQEFLDLLVNYCSQYIRAQELEEVNWAGLANRLGTAPQYLAEAAHACNAEGKLWARVIQDRIKRASAAKVFRDSGWERLESLAINKLTNLAERGLIKDTGELLAIASHARRATEAKSGGSPSGGTTINIGLGGESMDGSNGLPAAGTTMRLDLTPRLAQALQNKQERNENRVIDGQMLTVSELREALDSTAKPQVTQSADGNVFEGDEK